MTKNIVLKHFDELASDYDKKSLNRKKYLDSIDQIIVECLSDKKIKLLDVGCGTGKRAKGIQSKLKLIELYGCDLSPNMIEIAKHNIKNAKVLNMMNLTYKNNTFDAVTCLFNTFGYLDKKSDRIKVLNNFNRILKPGGLVFIDVMNLFHLGENVKFKRSVFTVFKEVVDAFVKHNKIGDKYFSIQVVDKKIKGYVHGFSPKELDGLAKKSNFNIEKKLIIGYDSGKKRKRITQGQLFYILRKKLC